MYRIGVARTASGIEAVYAQRFAMGAHGKPPRVHGFDP